MTGVDEIGKKMAEEFHFLILLFAGIV